MFFLSGHHRPSLREASHIISRGMRNSLVNVTLILLYFFAPSCTSRPQGIIFGGSPALDLYGIPSHGHDVVGDLDVDGRMYGCSQLREDADCQGSGKGRVHALRRFAETRTMKTGTTIAGVVFEVSAIFSTLGTSRPLYIMLHQSYNITVALVACRACDTAVVKRCSVAYTGTSQWLGNVDTVAVPPTSTKYAFTCLEEYIFCNPSSYPV